MTKSRRKAANRTPLLVFGGLALAALAGGALWIMKDVERARREAEAAARIVPTLPAGRLQLVSSTMQEAVYVSLDDVRRTADGAVSATVLKVGRKPDGVEGSAMLTRRESVDCGARRIYEGRIGAFDAEGRLKTATNGYPGGRPADPGDYEVPVLCEQAKGRIVATWRQAQREVQALPEAVAARAEADRRDADAWAWLCAAGVRNRWRSRTPADCAHALTLRPDDHATRLDRAYILLKIGRKAESDAEFARVLAADPKNATALYGRSLSHALRGDEGASRRDRGAALDLDEDVPNWVAQTYDLQVSREYRVR